MAGNKEIMLEKVKTDALKQIWKSDIFEKQFDDFLMLIRNT